VNDQRNHEGTTWQQAKVQVTNLDQKSKDLKKTDEGLVKELERLDQLGEEAVATSDGRLLWLEKALNEALPRDLGQDPPAERAGQTPHTGGEAVGDAAGTVHSVHRVGIR
jgi:hypothetical protein